jgi:nicotinamidase-related amidase
MDVDNAVLVVIDMQNGFVNEHSAHAVPAVVRLVERWTAAGRAVVFTRYRNYPGSPFERFFDWTRLREAPETSLVPELAGYAAGRWVVDKVGYSLFTARAVELVRGEGWTDLVFCGIATESCVLKSAVDAFERGFAPWIVTDATASDAGAAVHEAGLTVARRLIGRGQLVTAEQVLAGLDARREAAVPE